MFRPNRLDVDRAFVLEIDIQEKLLPAISNKEEVVRASQKLLQGVRIFGLPVLATEQYPKGIGPTDSRILSDLKSCEAAMFEKSTFSACDDQAVHDAMRRMDRPQVILLGIETHVCVQQTALDLRSMEYDVFICADAVGSRSEADRLCALSRMRQEGAYITTAESILFELCNRCDTDAFRDMLNVIKAFPPTEK